MKFGLDSGLVALKDVRTHFVNNMGPLQLFPSNEGNKCNVIFSFCKLKRMRVVLAIYPHLDFCQFVPGLHEFQWKGIMEEACLD